MRRAKAGTVFLTVAAPLVWAAACGGGSVGTGGNDGTGGAGVIVVDPNELGAPCQTTDDCVGSEMCHPVAGTCVLPAGTCGDQSECMTSTFCDAPSGQCLPGLTGSPCESDSNCAGSACTADVCGCTGFAQAQEGLGGPLDIYFIFDRTASMGQDCDYQPGGNPPVDSKACFATYALADYLTSVSPSVDTRLALQFMSLPGNGCDGEPYSEAQVPLTGLPVGQDHQLIQDIVGETFQGGFGTEIEGALRGITAYTANNRTPGREIIGVLMTDGDPNGCEENVGDLADVISGHLADTGIRTFIIGMDGATEENLEQLAVAGGADPHPDFCGGVDAPCRYWNVGNGSGDAIASALQAIIGQAVPLPCEYQVSSIQPPAGMTLDTTKINVTLTDTTNVTTTIVQVPTEGACPANQPAWFYDSPTAPATINLCASACNLVTTAETGARVSIVGGCQDTVILR